MKKADLGKATVIETDNFVIAGTLPEEKAKSLGAVLEKVVPVARKALDYGEKDEPWKGKLTIYYLPEGREFKSFIRTVLAGNPDGVHYELRADVPFVVDPVDVSGKASESDQFASTAAVVAGSYLKARAGAMTTVPGWLANGFGRATAMRAEGTTSKRYATYKTQARAAALGAKGGKPPALPDLWGESRPANADVLSTSFADYAAYGPGKDNFLKLVYGFRPDENGNAPAVTAAFEAAGWKDMAALEKAWLKWAATGK
jgi:hypothetical protein